MALDAELLSLKSAGTYRFERDLSTISNDTTTISNLRLVVGFSKVGPYNTANVVTSAAEFIKLYGNIDRSLEKKGSYFHRSALVALSAGPILCLNLLNLDPDLDHVQEKSFSTNIKEFNKYTANVPLNSVYNTDKFWYASNESFLDAIDIYLQPSQIEDDKDIDKMNWSDGLIHFTNISKRPVSILVKKASTLNTKGYELTLNEWYGEENVPEYLNGTSYVSDYMVEVYVVGGNFGPELEEVKGQLVNNDVDVDDDGTPENLSYFIPSTNEAEGFVANPYKRFTSDIVYQDYFDERGFIRKNKSDDTSDTKLNKFLNLPSVNLLAKYVGSLIPDFVDKLGRNIWIQKLVNDDVNTVGVLCAENVAKIENVNTESKYIDEAIDLVGHNIYNNVTITNENGIDKLDVDFLSYKFTLDNIIQKIVIEKEVTLVDGEVTDNIFADDINDGSSEDSDSDSVAINPTLNFELATVEYTYVRVEDGRFDKEDSTHPFAWVKLNDLGTPDYDGENAFVYTDASYIDDKFDNYAYDSYVDGSFAHQIKKVIGSLPFMTEFACQESLGTFYNSKNTSEENICTIKDNEAIVNVNDDITQGDYVVSYWQYDYDEDFDAKGESRFSRIARVVRTSYVYLDTDDGIKKYKKIVCSDNVWKTGRKINDSRLGYEYGSVIKITPIDKFCDRLQWICLNGFKMRNECMPDGTNERQNEILDMIREFPESSSTMSNLFKTLIDRDYIHWRYLVDTFGLGLEEECKKVYTELCAKRKSALAIINCPSQLDFKKSQDPSFINRNGGVNVEYIANGANLAKNPMFLFTLPNEENGASYGAYYYPYLRISDLGAVKSVPPAAYVSNLYIQKYSRNHAWAIVAGQNRGVISGNQVIGVEATLVNENRDWLEPVGINPIIWENGVGVEIYSNKTAKQTPKSALSSIHVREACIYIQDRVEDILRRYIFEYNTAQTRLEIKTQVDEFLETVKNNSGVYEYRTVMDTSNNSQEVIDNNMGVIDIYIEPVKGLEILAQRLTVMKTGGIASEYFS